MASAATVATVVSTAQGLGVDPLTALADSLQESGLDPTAVGDSGSSFGLFQLHRGGELGSLTPTQAFDPATNASVALGEFASVAKSSPGLSPGALAAAAERPANPGPYAAAVNADYASLASSVGEPPPASSSGFSGWLSKALGVLEGTGKTAAGVSLGNVGLIASGVGQAASSAAGALTSSLATDALKVALEIAFVLGGLALLVLGAERMFPGVTRTVVSTVSTGAKAAAVAA